MITITPVSGAIGAIIGNIDLSEPLEKQTIDEIKAALLEYCVVFFRDQNLNPENHISFSRCFGDLNIDKFVKGPDNYPEIMSVIKEPEDHRGFAGMWHSDVTFLDKPALGSILYARQVPPVGGDTMFSNMYLAFESLSFGMQEMLSNMNAIHSAGVSYDRSRMDETNKLSTGMKYTDQMPETETSTHPVIRTHPETGRKALYINSAYTLQFENMTVEESKPLLQYLYQHLGQPMFTCRFQWKKGSMAFWDNRCAQHLPINDFTGHRREMHRTTIAGDTPF